MLNNIVELERQLMQLSVGERAVLAEHLIRSLDETHDEGVEKAWQEEAEARYRNYCEGKTTSRPSAEVFRDAFNKFA